MLLFSADPTIFFLAHGELKKPPSKVAYFSSCWTVSVWTSKNDSICPAKKVYGSFELFGGHVMEQLLASKCTKIRVGGGRNCPPAPIKVLPALDAGCLRLRLRDEDVR